MFYLCIQEVGACDLDELVGIGIVLAGTSEVFAGPRVLEKTCSVGDLAESSYNENPSLR